MNCTREVRSDRLVLPLALALTLAAPFPLPSIDNKPVSVSDKQKSFRLPMRFEKVRAFYEERFGPGKDAEVKLKVSGAPGQRVLAIENTRKIDSWKRAVVKEGEVETTVDVTPVMRLAEEKIDGTGKPLVEFVIGRSGDVDRAVQGIDHTESMRAK